MGYRNLILAETDCGDSRPVFRVDRRITEVTVVRNFTSPTTSKVCWSQLENDSSGFSNWDFASTASSDLPKLAAAFGLKYREEDNQITHTMVIVLIARDGTVAKYWSEDWTVSELEDALKHQADLAKDFH